VLEVIKPNEKRNFPDPSSDTKKPEIWIPSESTNINHTLDNYNGSDIIIVNPEATGNFISQCL